MDKSEPLTKGEKIAATGGCMLILLTCCGLPSGCYMVLKTSLISDWMAAGYTRDLIERKQRLETTLLASVEDDSLTDEDALYNMARDIYGEDDTVFYHVQSVEASGEGGSPRTVRVVVLQEFEMELNQRWGL